jgi:hypothetical protein
MTTLYDKIAQLPPSLLPRVEHFVDSLPTTGDAWDEEDYGEYLEWEAPLYDENGEKIHPQPGCLKDVIVMHDNFFEPDDDWEEYL